MGIFKRDKAPAGVIELREGDEVSWQTGWGIHTGVVVAVAGGTAKAHDDRYRNSAQLRDLGSGFHVLPFHRFTLRRRAREDDKTEALTAVYGALRERADHGDLSAWTFLEEEWPALVSSDLRTLLNIGPEQADGAETPARVGAAVSSSGKAGALREAIERASADGAEIRIVDAKTTGEAPWTAA